MINLEEKFRAIANRHGELQSLMSAADLGADDFRKYSIEYSELEEIVGKIKQLDAVKKDIEAAKAIVSDAAAEAELKSMAQDEIRELEAASEQLNKEILVLLLPKDADDVKNAILEVRAGTGGEEAALFAADLFRMYQRYSENKGWRFEIMAVSDTGIGGYKEATALITGGGVFSFLKYESGVHRVQRVPDTEASGRIHTSAATVSVLAEVEDVDIQINEADLRIDVYRSSGAGGQHVNTTDSAVRITHIPTNTVVAVQDERSQHKNKAKAMKILRSRIYEAEKRKRDSAYAATRKSQVGSGDRSERIRTYNYPQGRVTDHRINLTLYKLQEFLNGSGLDDMQSALAAVEQAEKLATMQEL